MVLYQTHLTCGRGLGTVEDTTVLRNIEDSVSKNLKVFRRLSRRPPAEDYRNMREVLLKAGEKRIYYTVAGSLATLLPAIMWKVENVPHKLGDLISGQGGKSPGFFLLLILKFEGRGKCSRKNC